VTRPRFSRIVSQLQQQYREQAAAGDWQECIRIAELIGASDRALTAEAHYACGYALEQLGELERAAIAYQTALLNDRRHAKAMRAVARLGQQIP
jgi:hypothetical protein